MDVLQQQCDLAEPQRSPSEPDPTSTYVEKGIEHLKHCYRLGERFRKFSKDDVGLQKTKDLAKRNNIPLGEIPRYPQFVKTYTMEELDQLYALFRAENFVFFFTHFRTLMSVKSRARRAELAMEGIRRRLSIAALRRLKEKTVVSPKTQAGRKPDMLKQDDSELEESILREVKKLCRHLEQVLTAPRAINPDLKVRVQQLLKRLQKA